MTIYSGLGIPLSVKRKIFVSYHHHGDQLYYDIFSRTFHDTYDVISDNSVERKFDSDDVRYVMRRIREDHISGSSCTIVLVGQQTWGRKYVDWEIDATLEKQHGLIGVRLPSAPINSSNQVTVPDRLHHNIATGYAVWVTWDQVTSHPSNLLSFIEIANSKQKTLINNSAPRRERNSS